jgi:hypothetical protein
MAKDGAEILNAYCDAGRQALENIVEMKPFPGYSPE